MVKVGDWVKNGDSFGQVVNNPTNPPPYYHAYEENHRSGKIIRTSEHSPPYPKPDCEVWAKLFCSCMVPDKYGIKAAIKSKDSFTSGWTKDTYVVINESEVEEMKLLHNREECRNLTGPWNE